MLFSVPYRADVVTSFASENVQTRGWSITVSIWLPGMDTWMLQKAKRRLVDPVISVMPHILALQRPLPNSVLSFFSRVITPVPNNQHSSSKSFVLHALKGPLSLFAFGGDVRTSW